MSCAACAQHVSKAVNSLESVSCKFNLITNSMEVIYDENQYNEEDIINSVIKAGYSAKVYENEYLKSQQKKSNARLVKLIISALLTIILMYISMGHMINLPIFDINLFSIKISHIS